MGFFDFFKSKKSGNMEYMKKAVGILHINALRNVRVDGVSIVDNLEIYKLNAQSILRQKINRAQSDGEYIVSLKNNIYYYANTAHRYTAYLRTIVPNIPPRNKAGWMVDKIQEEARLEVREGKLNFDDIDAVISNAQILKAEDLPDMLPRVEALESIYAQLWVENDALIETIGLVVEPPNAKKLFLNHIDEIDMNVFWDMYFNRLREFTQLCNKNYPKIFKRR